MLLGKLPELLVVVQHPDGIHETHAAFAFHDAFDIVPLERRAEHAEHPINLRVAGDMGALHRKIVNVWREILLADVMKMATLFDKHFRAARVNARRAIAANRRWGGEEVL